MDKARYVTFGMQVDHGNQLKIHFPKGVWSKLYDPILNFGNPSISRIGKTRHFKFGT